MSPVVLLCGPIALPGVAAGGGYEACNSRTIEALRLRGLTVHELRFPQPKGGAWAKLSGYLRGFLRLSRELNRTPGEIFHLTGLYKHFVLPELLLLRLARRRGLRTIYDIRAGAMHRHYARLGPLYRWLFRKVLRSADQVMVEGVDYQPFVQQVTGRPAFYLPNHIKATGMPARQADQADATLRMIYVGRITVEKGVETALQTVQLLQQRGLACQIAIAGNGPAALMQRLRAAYPQAEWLGSLQSDAVLTQLGSSHWFLFPTRHTGEGHSNALTEAMAMGCVPVATDNGFNRSVIGDAGLVLPFAAEAAQYADAIEAAWNAGSWSTLSQRAAARTKELYSTEQAIARLHTAYVDLMKAPV